MMAKHISEQQREQVIAIRVNAAEKARFEAEARRSGMSVSAWIRFLCFHAPPTPPAQDLGPRGAGEASAAAP